jgi:DNA-binding NarL/FixJ family response regulator
LHAELLDRRLALDRSGRTVDVHIDHILTKLSFRTRTQLAARADEEGPLAENT